MLRTATAGDDERGRWDVPPWDQAPSILGDDDGKPGNMALTQAQYKSVLAPSPVDNSKTPCERSFSARKLHAKKGARELPGT